jgi:hypothetical protein
MASAALLPGTVLLQATQLLAGGSASVTARLLTGEPHSRQQCCRLPVIWNWFWWTSRLSHWLAGLCKCRRWPFQGCPCLVDEAPVKCTSVQPPGRVQFSCAHGAPCPDKVMAPAVVAGTQECGAKAPTGGGGGNPGQPRHDGEPPPIKQAYLLTTGVARHVWAEHTRSVTMTAMDHVCARLCTCERFVSSLHAATKCDRVLDSLDAGMSPAPEKSPELIHTALLLDRWQGQALPECSPLRPCCPAILLSCCPIAALLSCCPTAVLLSCRRPAVLLLSCCCPAALLSCRRPAVLLLSCCPAVLLSYRCPAVLLSYCRPAALLPCCPAAVLLSCCCPP